jgi:hypothetical protein
VGRILPATPAARLAQQDASNMVAAKKADSSGRNGRGRREQETLRQFYERSVRPRLIAVKQKKRAVDLAREIRRAEAWQNPLFLRDIDREWLDKYARYLADSRISKRKLRQRVTDIRRVACEARPFPFLADRVHWTAIEAAFLREPLGTFARYFCEVFAPRQKWKSGTKHSACSTVKQFVAWRGRPIALQEIDGVVLEQFRRFRLNAGVKPVIVRDQVGLIRRIVNHWEPGRIAHGKSKPLPDSRAGTVQHFVKNVYASRRGARGGRREGSVNITRVVSKFHDFCGGKGLPFAKFTVEFCEEFLRWCKDQGIGPVSLNDHYRCILNSISREAAAAGLMPRRLYLEPVAPFKRPAARAVGSPAKRRGGRPPRWAAVRAWLRAALVGNPALTPTELRRRFREENPGARLPAVDAFRAHVSDVRRDLMRAQETRA